MNRSRLDRRYRCLVSSLTLPEGEPRDRNDYVRSLAKVHTSAEELSKGLLEDVQRWEQRLRDRKYIQQVLQKEQWPSSTETMFWQEQMLFYQQWLQEYEQLLDGGLERCRIGLTAKELLLFVRLAKELGLLPDGTLKSSMLFLSSRFATANQYRLSYESLRKKYSELELNQLTSVKTILQRMLALVDSYIDRY